jgi:STE24 endopeptidase
MSAAPWLSAVFPLAIAAETATRLWLASRQIDAVRAHRDEVPAFFRGWISLPEQRKATDYTIARVQLGRVAAPIEALIKAGLTIGGGIAALDALTRRCGWAEPWRGMLLIAGAFLVLQVLGLPFALWKVFRIEARFGFNRVTPGMFAADLAKRLLLIALLGGPLLLATLTLMSRAGTWWWMWVWLVWMAASIGLTWGAPRFIAPLFNQFSPLADGELKQRVERLLERCGYQAQGGVFVMDGSRRTAHGNAYFTGIGRHKRIVFLDTFLARVDADEIEAVLAHELGHFRLKHIRQRLLLSMASTFACLLLLAVLAQAPAFYAALGVPVPSPAAALLLFGVSLPVFTFFATPLASWWSRRQELAADHFAAAHADAGKLIGALVKLYRDNASTLTPDRLHSAFYDSHPPAIERITRLQPPSPPDLRGQPHR